MTVTMAAPDLAVAEIMSRASSIEERLQTPERASRVSAPSPAEAVPANGYAHSRMVRSRRSLIALCDIDQIFNDAVIKDLSKTARAPTTVDLTRFAESIRNDVRIFIERKGRLGIPKLRKEISRLYGLSSRAASGGKVMIQLARAIDAMSSHTREWLARHNPENRKIPTAAEISSPETRAKAVERLRLILSCGGTMKDGRRRPGGRRSRSLDPFLRAPANIQANRPRNHAEREFVRNLGLTYLNATGKRPPYKVDFQGRGPFSKLVHRCFKLVGAPSGHVTRLINELGRERRKITGEIFEYPKDFSAHLNERERFYKELWRTRAQE